MLDWNVVGKVLFGLALWFCIITGIFIYIFEYFGGKKGEKDV